MSPLRRFFHLPLGDQRLLISSAALLVAVRIGLSLVPFHQLRKSLARMKGVSRQSRETDEAIMNRVVWAVSAAARRMPRTGDCLAQALTTQVILGRRGRSATLRIGVGRSDDGQFKAHAWLEADGNVVIGGSQALSGFVALPPLKEKVR